MKIILLAAVTLLILSAGCSKKNTFQTDAETQQLEATTPALTTGTLIGIVTPVPGSGVYLIVSRASDGQKIIADGYINTNGDFNFPGLPAGKYLLDLTTNARYLLLDNKTIQVSVGKQTDAGTIALTPNPNNGNIVGMIAPAKAASSFIVQCIDPFSTTTYAGEIDPATGKYEIESLPPGKWSVYFPANNGFKTPERPLAIVKTKQTADIGTVTFESAPFVSSISFKTSGYPLPVHMNGIATYDGTKLSLSGRYTKGVMNSIGDGTIQVAISLDQVTAPGTYVCNSTTTSKFTYSQKLYGLAPPNGSWSSLNTGATAIVTITKIDLLNKTISGTFTASLGASTTSAVRSMEISNGSFTAMYN